MTARLNLQLPSDDELLRAPQRSQLAALRLALLLTEDALVRGHRGINWSTVPSSSDCRTLAVARMLLARARELHALSEAYDQLLATTCLPDQHDDDIPF